MTLKEQLTKIYNEEKEKEKKNEIILMYAYKEFEKIKKAAIDCAKKGKKSLTYAVFTPFKTPKDTEELSNYIIEILCKEGISDIEYTDLQDPLVLLTIRW